MVFECDGTRYDTSDMEAYETPAMARYLQSQPVEDPCTLMLYLTRDHKLVFVLTLGSQRGVNIHRAAPDEIRQLAADYHIPDLLKALP